MTRLSSLTTAFIMALLLAIAAANGQDKQGKPLEDFPRPSRSVGFPPKSKPPFAGQAKSGEGIRQVRVVPQIDDTVLEVVDYFTELGNQSRYNRHTNLLEQYKLQPTAEQSIEIARVIQRMEPHLRSARSGIQLMQNRQWRLRGIETQVFELVVNATLPKDAWADWKTVMAESDNKVFSVFLTHWNFKEVPGGSRRREESEPLAQARRRLLNDELTRADLFRLWTAAKAANESLILCEKKQRSLDHLCSLLPEAMLRRFTESPKDVPEHGDAFGLVQADAKLFDDDSYRKMIEDEKRFDEAGIPEKDLKEYDDGLKLRFAYRPTWSTMVQRLTALNLSLKEFATYRKFVENCYPEGDDSKKRLVGYRPREGRSRVEGFQIPGDRISASSRRLAGPSDEFGRRIDSLQRADTLKHIEKMDEWRRDLVRISSISKDVILLEGYLGEDAKRFFKAVTK